MTAAARKQEGRGYGAPFVTTSTPNPQFNFEGVDYGLVRLRANRSIKELRTLGQHRLETGQPLNMNRHAYLWARARRLFKAGVYRDTRGKNWTRYQRVYAFPWLDPTIANYFLWIGLFDPTEAQKEAVEAGIRSALISRAKGFCDPDKAAEMLDVDMAERSALGLSTIGAVDCTREERKTIAMLKKKEADRTRAAAKRAAAGARPRSQSYSSVKPWAAFDMSRRTFYRLDEAERVAMLEQALSERGTNSSRVNISKNMACDEVVPSERPTNDPVLGLGPIASDPPPAERTANVIRLPLNKAAAFCRANPGVRIGSPGWREKYDAFLADIDDEARALDAPPPIVVDEPPPPAEAVARLDWWNKPVEGWREGRLEIRSILTGEATVIRLSDGAILSRSPQMEEQHEDESF